MRIAQRAIFFLTCLLIAGCGEKSTESRISAVEPFYGSYAGSTESTDNTNEAARDLAVVIKPWEDRGFTVDWSTVIYRDGGEKKTQHSISFYPSPREGIFASAMETNVFGLSVPFDPVVKEENPYVWATLNGKTLTISALYITDDGGYEMQVYERTLGEEGITVEFERLSNGERVAQVSARLQSTE